MLIDKDGYGGDGDAADDEEKNNNKITPTKHHRPAG